MNICIHLGAFVCVYICPCVVAHWGIVLLSTEPELSHYDGKREEEGGNIGSENWHRVTAFDWCGSGRWSK